MAFEFPAILIDHKTILSGKRTKQTMVSMIMCLFNGDMFLMNVFVSFFCSQQDLVGTLWINVYLDIYS